MTLRYHYHKNPAYFVTPFLILSVWAAWFILSPGPPFSYIADNREVSLTMLFGSLIAGGTSEGGGAVAFPVFTKLLHISPYDAKVFSLAIQSVGMTTASIVILVMRSDIEYRSLLWVTLGGIPGIILGSVFIAPHLPPDVIRISFTAMLTGFGLTLFALNMGMRNRNMAIPVVSGYENYYLFATGVAGGIISGLVGNGIDIFAFSLMVLFFRVCEKVATPTSVILMAINAITGFVIHYFFLGGFTREVEGYWLAAVPVVVVGAPVGAIICNYLKRETIARFLIFLIIVELISSLIIIPLSPEVVAAGAGTFLFYAGIYYLFYRSRRYEAADESN